jgi:hypothetical protein
MSRSVKTLAVSLVATTALGLLITLQPFASEGDPDVTAEVALTFQDEQIAESSGLVVRGDRVFTINDSGDGPYVYAVDRSSGETVAVTTFDDEDPEDLEAIAPGSGRSLWVGDIGDNQRSRGSVRVHRLVPSPTGGTVEARSFDLVYPDGAHDAETLLVHPRTEELLVVTKRPFIGGVVYRAPTPLREGELHQLQEVGAVSGMVTDGAFLPDGRHVVVRTVGGAAVYTYPGFDKVAEFALPVQDQGEGIAIGDDGRVYLSSEGELSDVLVMDLPPLEPADSAVDEAVPTAGGDRGRDDAEDDAGPAPDEGNGAGLGRPPGYVLAAVLGSAVVGLLVRASRRRSRRRR